MYESEHYQYDAEQHSTKVWCSTKKRTIRVPLLTAKEEYADRIQQTRQELHKGSIRDRVGKIKDLAKNPKLRDPRIFELTLHPQYDILRTGGFMGSHYLIEERYNQLPNKLEDFTDEDMVRLLEMLIVPIEELLELQDLERRLAETNPDYRIIRQS